MVKMKWVPQPELDPQSVSALQQSLSTKELFPEPLAKVLLQRDIRTLESAKEFFNPESIERPSPWLIMGMENAVNRIMKAIVEKERILLYGDYDVDGTTSIALLKLYFDAIGYPVSYYVPDRFKEGYGLSLSGLQWAEEQEFSLIIVLDCGTKEIEKVKFAKSRGLDLIICDHHKPGGELPDVCAFINPLQPGCKYPFKELSACGLALKLAEALEEKLQTGTNVFQTWGDLVVLSVACDLVQLYSENRTLAAMGLKKLQERPILGVKALMELSATARDWEMDDLLFFLGPRINSAGRRAHASRSVDLLCGDLSVLNDLAAYLNESNEWRKQVDTEITVEAINQIESNPIEKQKFSTVLANEAWHKGVIGIVASRLVEEYYRPTIILTKSEGLWVGSARSINGFDLYEALVACSPLLLQFGGHKYAAGLTVQEQNLEAFLIQFESVVKERMGGERPVPVLEIATDMDFSYLNDKFVRLLKRMGPFGPGNMEPIFATRGVSVLEARIMKGEHLKLILKNGSNRIEAVGFNLANKWLNQPFEKINIAWQAGYNTWNGVKSIQLKIKDFESGE